MPLLLQSFTHFQQKRAGITNLKQSRYINQNVIIYCNSNYPLSCISIVSDSYSDGTSVTQRSQLSEVVLSQITEKLLINLQHQWSGHEAALELRSRNYRTWLNVGGCVPSSTLASTLQAQPLWWGIQISFGFVCIILIWVLSVLPLPKAKTTVVHCVIPRNATIISFSLYLFQGSWFLSSVNIFFPFLHFYLFIYWQSLHS